MVSIKGISESHLRSIRIHTCQTYARLSAEWAAFHTRHVVSHALPANLKSIRADGAVDLNAVMMASQKVGAWIFFFIPSENRQPQFIFHNYHFEANAPRPHSTLTPTRGIKDNYCRHHIKLQLLVCLFVSLCGLKLPSPSQ